MISKLIEQIKAKDSCVCVGLDPQIEFIPEALLKESAEKWGPSLETVAEAFFKFNCAIIDAVSDLVPAVKPQIAMYEQYGIPGLIAFSKTVEYAKSQGLIVVGDVKRGDIGSTSKAYAKAHLGDFEILGKKVAPFNEDFATVNPYLGTDGIKPFLDVCNENDKGIFVLVKTSNPSSGEFQDKLIDGRPLYEVVADKVNEWGSLSMDGEYSNVGAVVGATYPEMGVKLRKQMPKTFILVPGYGAQGGKGSDLKGFFNPDGLGALVNSSRGIIAAYKQDKYARECGDNFALAAKLAVIDMNEDINSNK